MEAGRKGNVTRAVLTALGVSGVIVIAVAAPNMIRFLKPIIEKAQGEKRVNRDSLRRALDRLRKQHLIEIFFKGDKTVLKITESGKIRLREFDFDTVKLPLPEKRPKVWTIVLFDIPEGKKAARDALRMKLNELGCFQFNRSVFVYPQSCGDEIDFVTEFFDVSRYVSHFETNSLGVNEYKARKHFNLVK